MLGLDRRPARMHARVKCREVAIHLEVLPEDAGATQLRKVVEQLFLQGFRDPGFLGIVNPENDAVYLPLKKGRNELMLAVSELGGGWGFICRLLDLED